jgi:single-strand DNA-binding protein
MLCNGKQEHSVAWSLNRVELVGNVGKDPDIRTTQDGLKIVNLSLATSESWTDKSSGERKERTEWHRVVIFNERLADVAERYVSKGTKLYVEGQLQTRKWQDQSGQDRFSTEVVVQRFKGELGLLGGGGQGEGEGQGQRQRQGGGERRVGSNGSADPRYGTGRGGGQTNYSTQAPARGPNWDAPSGGGMGGGDLDDEIPFGPCWQ